MGTWESVFPVAAPLHPALEFPPQGGSHALKSAFLAKALKTNLLRQAFTL